MNEISLELIALGLEESENVVIYVLGKALG